MRPSDQFIEDSIRWRGKVLRGPDAHWCGDWDELPVSACTPEYDCCTCKKSLLGRIFNWFYMKWWNFTEQMFRMDAETVAFREATADDFKNKR